MNYWDKEGQRQAYVAKLHPLPQLSKSIKNKTHCLFSFSQLYPRHLSKEICSIGAAFFKFIFIILKEFDFFFLFLEANIIFASLFAPTFSRMTILDTIYLIFNSILSKTEGISDQANIIIVIIIIWQKMNGWIKQCEFFKLDRGICFWLKVWMQLATERKRPLHLGSFQF